VPANNTSTATVVVVDDIPAVGGYGLMLLALVLGVVGAFVARNRM
jgi:hypothetical protein